MEIKNNINFFYKAFVKLYPWIKSREKLFFKILIDSISIFFILNKDNLQNISITNIFISIIIFIIWDTLSYIIGRYESDFRALKEYLSTELNTLSFFFIIIFFIDKIFISYLIRYPQNPLNYQNLFLIIICSFLFQLIINSRNFKTSKKKENWIFLNNSINSKIFDDILDFSRLKTNIKFVHFDDISNLNFQVIDGIVIDDINKLTKYKLELISNLKFNNIKLVSLVEWAEMALQRYPPELISDFDPITEKILVNFKKNRFEIRLKRISEFFITIILLFFSFPILLFSALLIKLEDGGPIFYTQVRTGYKGDSFKILKLRTMRTNSEKNGPVWSSKNDQRITKIGGFLRKSRIDEIPQLLLVISGKLSLIGPRPERPDFDNSLREIIPNYDLRYFMKPGLSGWAQVNYPYGASQKDAQNKLSYDLYYISNFSNLLDLLILFKTIKLVFNRKGAIALS